MNSTENMHPGLTKTASIEYANLFRGLSTFELDPSVSILADLKNDSKSDQDLNKDHNLTDMLLQQQDVITSTNPKLARLNTVREIKIENNHENDMHVNREHGVVESTSEINNNNITDSIIHASNEKNTNKTLINHRNREKINVKRLSTTSTTSSTASSSLNNTTNSSQPKRRGRKPISSNPDEAGRYTTKKQLIIEQSKGNMVYFGNKLVEKKTAEYDKRRQNNNEAVKKCRQKLAEEQKKKEDRMKELNDENIKLNNTVDQLSKELSLLKSIIAKMSPDQKLPEYLEQLIKNMEEDSS